MEKYDIRLYDLNKASEKDGIVYVEEDKSSDGFILKITVENKVITARAEDYLSAYQELRDKLLKKGFGLKCSGSLINAHQSAMMSYVPQIYLVEMGKQALAKNIVSIWSYCDIKTFPDTDEQHKYIEKWFESLKA